MNHFINITKKQKKLYEKEEKNDSEMQLLDDVYRQVEEGGWLDNV